MSSSFNEDQKTEPFSFRKEPPCSKNLSFRPTMVISWPALTKPSAGVGKVPLREEVGWYSSIDKLYRETRLTQDSFDSINFSKWMYLFYNSERKSNIMPNCVASHRESIVNCKPTPIKGAIRFRPTTCVSLRGSSLRDWNQSEWILIDRNPTFRRSVVNLLLPDNDRGGEGVLRVPPRSHSLDATPMLFGRLTNVC